MIHTVINIKGKIDPGWSDWFEGMAIRVEPSGATILTGDLPDQSAVYGVISRLSCLGIAMVSVRCQEAGKNDLPSGEPG